MPTLLKVTRIDEVSLVDVPANPEAKLKIFKRAEEEDTAETEPVGKEMGLPMMPEPQTTATIMAEHEAMEHYCKLKDALWQSLNSIFEWAPLTEQPNLLQQSVTEFASAARAVLSARSSYAKAAPLIEELDTITKIGRKVSASRMARLRAIMRELEAIMMDGESEEKAPMTKTVDEQLAQLTKRAVTAEDDANELSKKLEAAEGQAHELTKRAETAEASVTKLQAQLDEQDPEAIWKGVSPQLRLRIEKAEAERDAERQARQKQEFIQKVASYKALPLNPDDDWEIFRDMTALPAKSQRRIEAVLKAAEEGMRQAHLFSEVGRGGTGEPQGDALDKLETLASERVAKGLSKTKAQAMDAILQENPALYKQYKLERQGGKY